MARSPDSAKAVLAANQAHAAPTKQSAAGRRLKGPDGFVYAWTEALSKMEGFVEFRGETDKAGFAKMSAATPASNDAFIAAEQAARAEE